MASNLPSPTEKAAFIAWLKANGAYNRFESGVCMERMHRVWELCGSPRGKTVVVQAPGSRRINSRVIMPERLTAENGAKVLLAGEFFETTEIDNPDHCGCGECGFCVEFPDAPETLTVVVPVSWTNIKRIYDKVVENRFSLLESREEGTA